MNFIATVPIFCWILCNVAFGQLTLPLTSHRLKLTGNGDPSHNLGRHQTYPLQPLRSIFTLQLIINGLPYELSIDTGSADLFIKGHGMDGNPLEKYRCDKCIQRNDKELIGYLDGTLMTYHLRANVSLGKHYFKEDILVAYYTESINFKQMGGIVGLYFQEIAINTHPNFINTLIKEKIISHYIFAVKLNFKRKEDSFITFGGYDKKFIAHSHKLSYYNIPNNSKQYKLEIKNVVLGDKTFNIKQAILDTGNTCISIPDQYTQDILNQFNTENNQCKFKKENNQFEILQCLIGTFSQLPILYINFHDQSLEITKEYYLDRCHPQNDNNIYKCTTLLQNVRHLSRIFLGDTFFLRYYAVFDLQTRRIGLAKNNDVTTLRDIIFTKN